MQFDVRRFRRLAKRAQRNLGDELFMARRSGVTSTACGRTWTFCSASHCHTACHASWIADVTEPMVIRKALLHVQSRAPPRGGTTGVDCPDDNTLFTLAG